MNPVRILPALVLSLVVMLGMRGMELWTGLSAIGHAHASDATQTAAAAPSAPSAQPAVASADAPPAASPVANVSAPQPLAAPPSDAPMDMHLPSLGNSDAADPPPLAPMAGTTAATQATQTLPPPRPKIPGEQDFMSASEIEVLSSLTKRREELDKREAELDMRDKLLQATEQRLDQKLTEIKALDTQIQAAVRTLDDKQSKQIASLVKVYETMKPKDAAQIMQDLDKNILLEVAARIKESKMAPILAAMDPAKARDITVMLAKRNEVPGNT
jgi:flagellar motility protein MotE (MotC chaperone)